MRSEVAMSGYIRIRVFQDEKQTLKEVARKKGTSLSELIRASALAEAGQRIEA
ncbi:plasmid mobilization protein [Brucella rhizosphaerae]|uniref:plasmid mobilization protein n=1 Tax=Brucella rhizosphaerae TaxID=571254 RepID=UPI0004AC96A0|nr:hypothetical protein [Brucella rhizosphaerae]